ncbi:MAG: DUF2190 family protein, partial [Elusimicrobiales bacterium]|nr:DUF2190 family protein [Elusimicrobiales bacterium]
LVDTPNAAGVNGTIILAGKTKVIAGGAISAGDPVTSDASGLAVAAAPAVGANAGVVGFALEDAVAGDLVKILASPGSTQG